MKRTLITTVVIAGLASAPAFAAHHKEIDGTAGLTTEQNTKLTTAMKDAGCEGGKITTENKDVIVKGSTCGTGTYDLMYDSNFNLKGKSEVKK